MQLESCNPLPKVSTRFFYQNFSKIPTIFLTNSLDYYDIYK